MSTATAPNQLTIRKIQKPSDLRLLNDQVLVQLVKPERMTASKTLYIPETAKREAYEVYVADVLAVGPGAIRKVDGKRNPMEVAVGDRVQFYWAAGEMQNDDLEGPNGEQWSIIRETMIQAVIG